MRPTPIEAIAVPSAKQIFSGLSNLELSFCFAPSESSLGQNRAANSQGTRMALPSDFEALKTRLIQIKPDLPKRLQQVAAFALENPQEMALGTASSIAARAQVQPSTLVRFAQAIGFGGFSELQGVFRSHLRNRWPDYSERMKALHARARARRDLR